MLHHLLALPAVDAFQSGEMPQHLQRRLHGGELDLDTRVELEEFLAVGEAVIGPRRGDVDGAHAQSL